MPVSCSGATSFSSHWSTGSFRQYLQVNDGIDFEGHNRFIWTLFLVHWAELYHLIQCYITLRRLTFQWLAILHSFIFF